MISALEEQGFCIVPTGVAASDREGLRSSLFLQGEAGVRCLLDEPLVRAVGLALKSELTAAGALPATAVAIQAIAFDKTSDANWAVAWHQDLMFPFARPVASPDYTMGCVKGGVDFARPPRTVLEELLAVRLHLDPCDSSNGPLRVAPGSHRCGIIPGGEVAQRVAECGEATCLADEGNALLMRPLLLHASSRAAEPKHRRVLHFVFHSGAPTAEPWHRAISD